MTRGEFKKLPTEIQFKITFKEGRFLHSISYSNERAVLYSLHLFFVEVVFDLRVNELIELKPFEEGFLLERYARCISSDLKNDQSFDNDVSH